MVGPVALHASCPSVRMDDRFQALEAQLHGLWIQALEGEQAYKQLLISLSGPLRGYFGRKLRSLPSDVEDLVQETLMAIHQKRHTYESDQPLTAWVFSIGRHKWIDHLRSHGRRAYLHDDIDDWEHALFAPDINDSCDAQHDLDVLLSHLPYKQRQAIERTKLQGLSVAETAQLIGQSQASVKVNVHRGLKVLSSLWRSSK